MKRKVATSSASFDSALEKAFLCLSQLGMARKLRTEQTKGKTEQIQLDCVGRDKTGQQQTTKAKRQGHKHKDRQGSVRVK